MSVTKIKIVKCLSEVGLKTNDIVMVHSSLSSMGYVEGGADTVIDSLLEVIGKNGTLVMPAFTFSCKPKGKNFFNPDLPSGMGKISETFRLRNGVLRSNHPTHSVSAIGPKAKELTENSEHYTLSSAGYFGKLIQYGAYISLLGITQTSNTLIHYIEGQVRGKLPYLKARWWGDAPDTKHNAFDSLEKYLVKYNVINFGRIGNATLRLMNAKKLVEVSIRVLLKEDPNALLCDNSECEFCMWAKEKNSSKNWRN